LIGRINSQNLDVALLAPAYGKSDLERYYGRGGDNTWHLPQDGPHVFDRKQIGGEIGNTLGSCLILREDPVHTDPIDLLHDVLFARQADGYDQDQGCGTDCHTKRCEHKPDFIGAEDVIGKPEVFANCYLGSEAGRHGEPDYLKKNRQKTSERASDTLESDYSV
jgi:hypothetical protein